MPSRLPVVSWKSAIKALGEAGFHPVRQRGSHIILENSEGKFTVVPRHDEIAPTLS